MSPSNVDYAILPLRYAVAAHDICCHSVASLTFLVWNSVVTLDDEVQYIWTMRHKNPFKWMYLFLRYVVILAHIAHNSLIGTLANNSSLMLCRSWHAYIVAFTQSLQTLLEIILAFRVFALYNRSRKIAFLMSTLISAEVAGSIRMIIWLTQDSNYYGTCLIRGVSKHGMEQSILGFIVHCILIALTLFKYFFALKAGWGRTPLVSLVVRENSTAYASMLFVLISVVILCGLENERGIAVFYWASAMTSVTGCHMILSMERFASKEIFITGSPRDQPLFTSKFSLETFYPGTEHDESAP